MGVNGNSNTQRKLKVVWLCYFSNAEVQNKLNPYKKIGEIAPWISQMIPLFEEDENIELHIISQHEWISCYKSFIKKGVNYHFFNKGIPLIGRHWPGFFRFDLWTDFFFTKKIISKIAKKINPDIIHMHGTENDFCGSVNQFKNNYPVFITIQGFIHKTTHVTSKIVKKRIKNELRILKIFNHYGYRTKTMGKDIFSINPNAILHLHGYPMKKITPQNTEKKYDLVFFARICKDKGIEDLLKAVAIIKKERPNISLCVIGSGKIDTFKKLAEELGIKKNIYWAGFLPTQGNVHNLASTARISVLPTYHDIISGTIIESLFLGLPVVAYNVGSIHEVNEYDTIISLVEKGDIQNLAQIIVRLLNDDKVLKEIAGKGRQRTLEMFNQSNVRIKKNILNAYNKVISDFYNN